MADRRYSREDLIKAVMDATALELEHEGNPVPTFDSIGVDVEDMWHVARNYANHMVDNYDATHSPPLNTDEKALMLGAAVASWLRGFATAAKLVADDR